MKTLTVLFLLVASAFAQTPAPTPAPASITINTSLGKVRAQLMADAAETHFEVKENTEGKLIVQGKSQKRAEIKYGLLMTRIGSIPDRRITYRFTEQGEAVTIEASTELVSGNATGPDKKGEKELKKQLAALKKKLEH
ncbi:MAG: hypothetical protein U0Y68_27445 [Blastocatellia bacterium]